MFCEQMTKMAQQWKILSRMVAPRVLVTAWKMVKDCFNFLHDLMASQFDSCLHNQNIISVDSPVKYMFKLMFPIQFQGNHWSCKTKTFI